MPVISSGRPLLAVPGPQSVAYVNNNTGTSYMLNTKRTKFTIAQTACNALGGHLVSYGSVAEQVRHFRHHCCCALLPCLELAPLS